jgi:hypothetical protein
MATIPNHADTAKPLNLFKMALLTAALPHGWNFTASLTPAQRDVKRARGDARLKHLLHNRP